MLGSSLRLGFPFIVTVFSRCSCRGVWEQLALETERKGVLLQSLGRSLVVLAPGFRIFDQVDPFVVIPKEELHPLLWTQPAWFESWLCP